MRRCLYAFYKRNHELECRFVRETYSGTQLEPQTLRLFALKHFQHPDYT